MNGASLPDERNAEDVLYPKANLVWSGILMFLLGLGSRRQFRVPSPIRPPSSPTSTPWPAGFPPEGYS